MSAVDLKHFLHRICLWIRRVCLRTHGRGSLQQSQTRHPGVMRNMYLRNRQRIPDISAQILEQLPSPPARHGGPSTKLDLIEGKHAHRVAGIWLNHRVASCRICSRIAGHVFRWVLGHRNSWKTCRKSWVITWQGSSGNSGKAGFYHSKEAHARDKKLKERARRQLLKGSVFIPCPTQVHVPHTARPAHMLCKPQAQLRAVRIQENEARPNTWQADSYFVNANCKLSSNGVCNRCGYTTPSIVDQSI